MIKTHKIIDYDDNINMEPFLLQDNKNKSCKKQNYYELQNVIQHSGNYGGGHYYCINYNNNNPNNCSLANDDYIYKNINMKNINKKDSYMLLFKLKQ